MSRKDLKLSEKEKLQQENNLLKAKLIAENGGTFYESEDEILPPEMENEWLNYIYNYEKVYQNARKISVYEKVGKPSFKPSRKLDDTAVAIELDKLLQKMIGHGVELNWLADYDDRVIYEFIIEELFEFEVEDIKMEGFCTCFTYEDFHTNHDYDIRTQTEDFVTSLLSNEWHEMDGAFLMDTLTDLDGQVITKETFCRNIKLFQESYRTFDIRAQHITHSSFDLENGAAIVEVDLTYEAVAEAGGEIRKFYGKTILNFQLDNGYWNIHKVNIPGFNI